MILTWRIFARSPSLTSMTEYADRVVRPFYNARSLDCDSRTCPDRNIVPLEIAAHVVEHRSIEGACPCASPTPRNDSIKVFRLDILIALDRKVVDGRAFASRR